MSLLREDLVGRTAYGAPQVPAPVRLNTNESPHPLPPAAATAILDALAARLPDLNRYPDRDAAALRLGLAGFLGEQTGVSLGPEWVWAANGSNEIFQQLLAAYGGPGRTALGFPPSYSMHPLLALATATGWVDAAPADPTHPQYLAPPSVDRVVAAITDHDPSIVILVSPNNPTGASIDPEVIEAACATARGLVVVDEAYGEFTDAPSALTLLHSYPRLLVTRTMSKAFGLAGARVGYLVGDPDLLSGVHLVRLPYHLSTLNQVAAEAALTHRALLLPAVADLRRERDRLVSGLRALGLTVHGSDANFVLFGGLADSAATWQALVDRGVLVRDVAIPGTLRVTAGTPAENSAFLSALTDVLGAQR